MLLFRFRRDVLEGTLEEMLEDDFNEADTSSKGNETNSERVRRQADFPGASKSDKSGK